MKGDVVLSEQLFEKCEEFFDLISSEHRTDEMEEIMDQVTDFLTQEIDGYVRREPYITGEEVESLIKELWKMIPKSERQTNNNLRDYYEDILETTSLAIDGKTLDYSDNDLEDLDFDAED